MIQLTMIDGRTSRHHYDDIRAIEEPSASGGWHGTRAIVRLSDGTRVEVIHTPDEIERMIAAEREKVRGGPDYQTKD